MTDNASSHTGPPLYAMVAERLLTHLDLERERDQHGVGLREGDPYRRLRVPKINEPLYHVLESKYHCFPHNIMGTDKFSLCVHI